MTLTTTTTTNTNTQTTDMVNHPKHYEDNSLKLEPIDILENLSFTVGNTLKYLIRAQDKGNEVQDLKKALWYHDRVTVDELEEYYKFLWVFKYSKNPILRSFSEELMQGNCWDVRDAWANLGGRICMRVEALEGGDF